MFQIAIFSKDSQAAILWFNTKEVAESQLQNIQMVLAGKVDTDSVTEKDDFGATIIIAKSNISHVIFNDMNKQRVLFSKLEGMGLAKKN